MIRVALVFTFFFVQGACGAVREADERNIARVDTRGQVLQAFGAAESGSTSEGGRSSPLSADQKALVEALGGTPKSGSRKKK